MIKQLSHNSTNIDIDSTFKNINHQADKCRYNNTLPTYIEYESNVRKRYAFSILFCNFMFIISFFNYSFG